MGFWSWLRFGFAGTDKQMSAPPVSPEEKAAFDRIVGENLSGVTFLETYVQLQFNPPPTLNVYNPVTVEAAGGKAAFGEPAFANLVIAQLGKVVRAARVASEELRIDFMDGSTIRVSLRPEDYEGPEGIELHRGKEPIVVL